MSAPPEPAAKIALDLASLIASWAPLVFFVSRINRYSEYRFLGFALKGETIQGLMAIPVGAIFILFLCFGGLAHKFDGVWPSKFLLGFPICAAIYPAAIYFFLL